MENISLSFLIDNQEGYFRFHYILGEGTMLGDIKVMIKFIKIYLDLIYPTIASCDSKQATFQYHKVFSGYTYAFSLKHVTFVIDFSSKIIFGPISSIKGFKVVIFRQGDQQSHLHNQFSNFFCQRFKLMKLVIKVSMSMDYFVLNLIDIEITLHFTVLNLILELLPDSFLIANLFKSEIHKRFILD